MEKEGGHCMTAQVDAWLARTDAWHDEFVALRQILLACGVSEDFKWGWPCYTDAGHNVVLMHGFKEYCALLFFKGVLLDDPAGLLVAQTANVQSARQMRFRSVADITAQQDVIAAYVRAAVAVERAGLEVEMKRTDEFAMCDEFVQYCAELPELAQAFKELTPGRQRAYLLYFAAPKQSKTRLARIEKFLPHILAGKGLHD